MDSPFKKQLAANRFYDYSKGKVGQKDDSFVLDNESEEEDQELSLEMVYL